MAPHSRVNTNGEVPIYCRLTYNNKRNNTGVDFFIFPEDQSIKRSLIIDFLFLKHHPNALQVFHFLSETYRTTWLCTFSYCLLVLVILPQSLLPQNPLLQQ